MRAHAGRYFGVATFGSQVSEEQRPNQRVIVIQSSTRIALAAIKLLRNALKVLLDCEFTLRDSFGDWCNGSTTDSDSVSPSSNLGFPISEHFYIASAPLLQMLGRFYFSDLYFVKPLMRVGNAFPSIHQCALSACFHQPRNLCAALAAPNFWWVEAMSATTRRKSKTAPS